MTGDREVYGFRLSGPRVAALPHLLPPRTIRPVLQLSESDQALPDADLERTLVDGQRIFLRRDPPVAHIQSRRHLSDGELVHPYLAPIAALHARWRGWEALHGGAVVVAGNAWAVLGAANAGKSTLLAMAAQRGHTVLADDLLVIDDGGVMPGPRCVDLRLPVLAPLTDVNTLSVRAGRGRVALADAPAPAPLAGVVHVAPGARETVRELRPAERLTGLLAVRRWSWQPGVPQDMLRYASLPAFALTRGPASTPQSLLVRLEALEL